MKNHFTHSELECKCGCGLYNINAQLLEDLNIAREIANIPFIITSGTRCEVHNKNVGGIRSSSHTTGHAVDIRADDGSERHKVLSALILAGFNRIGIHKHFIHVDNDPIKPKNITWVYK